MCDANILATGLFEPITIRDNKLSFQYRDKAGKRHVLIEEFEMDLVITKASVRKISSPDGETIAYEFRVE
jgi:hypothetical protein